MESSLALIGGQTEATMFKKSTAVAGGFVAILVGLTCSSSGPTSSVGDGALASGGQAGSTSSSGGGGGQLCTSISNCCNGVLDFGEQCDDGNTNNGDGCNSLCQIESNYECPTAGWPCIDMAVCGNGVLTSNKVCDDSNTVSGDGCSGDCQTIEAGWQCPRPGKPCIQICGASQLDGSVTCDAGKVPSGSCGDGVVMAGEECDCGDGTVPVPAGCPGPNNDTIYGGCTTQCTWGSFCGDAIVNGPEECDLGKMNGSNNGAGGCMFGCVKPRYCGDGIIEDGEMCDLGPLNGGCVDYQGNPVEAGCPFMCSKHCTLPI